MELNVKNIMKTGIDNSVVNRGSLFREVLEEMNQKRLGVVNVVENKRLIGIVTDGDVRRLLLKTQASLPDLFTSNVEKIMVKNPKTINPDFNLNKALEILEANRFWVLPVVNEEKVLLGTIHMHDLLKGMMKMME